MGLQNVVIELFLLAASMQGPVVLPMEMNVNGAPRKTPERYLEFVDNLHDSCRDDGVEKLGIFRTDGTVFYPEQVVTREKAAPSIRDISMFFNDDKEECVLVYHCQPNENGNYIDLIPSADDIAYLGSLAGLYKVAHPDQCIIFGVVSSRKRPDIVHMTFSPEIEETLAGIAAKFDDPVEFIGVAHDSAGSGRKGVSPLENYANTLADEYRDSREMFRTKLRVSDTPSDVARVRRLASEVSSLGIGITITTPEEIALQYFSIDANPPDSWSVLPGSDD